MKVQAKYPFQDLRPSLDILVFKPLMVIVQAGCMFWYNTEKTKGKEADILRSQYIPQAIMLSHSNSNSIFIVLNLHLKTDSRYTKQKKQTT